MFIVSQFKFSRKNFMMMLPIILSGNIKKTIYWGKHQNRKKPVIVSASLLACREAMRKVAEYVSEPDISIGNVTLVS